eukprot:GHVR01115351.1.p1 GENE.GHVR01115351.1~~GHVR01115351.1.p1  ORF type:complete len:152 (-),score=32.13 GHVR01115351.1:267-722(-)
MSLAWFPPSETEQSFGQREPTPYERHIEQARQERELKRQIKRYGEDAMRVDPEMNLTDAASSMPTESFTRAYQMRMPGSKAEKAKEKDPLASLMKALKIDVTKTRQEPTGDGTKHSHGTDKEKQKFHGSRNRYPRMRADREQTEAFAQDAA